MIVNAEEALRIFNKIPKVMRSFYYHPQYVINDALYKKDLEPVFFVEENNNEIYYHAFHLGKVPNTTYFDIQSPYGYGGPLCFGGEEFISKSIENYKKWCKDQSVIIEFIRFHPLLKNENNYFGYVKENRQTVYIDLIKENLFSNFSSRVRGVLRKAQDLKVTITLSKSEEHIQQFITIYTILMAGKNANEDYFFNENYFIQLLQNDSVYLVSAENETGQVIGASIFFTCGNLAEYHLSASTEEGRKKNVTTLLIYHFAELAKKQNMHLLYLGGGTDNRKENSLLFYKRGFSKNEIPFLIGSFKHNHTIYEELRSAFIKNNSKKEQFILFYR